MKIVTVSEMKAIEEQADAHGLSYATMMQHAGEGLARWVLSPECPVSNKTVLGLVGSGNNGGDALVALTHLAKSGWQSCAYLVRPRKQEDPLCAAFLKAGGRILEAASDPRHTGLAGEISKAGVLMDGILGTGVRLPLEPAVAQTMKFVNGVFEKQGKKCLVVAVDCPSGVNCEDGEVAPETIHADVTLTMAAVKSGLLTFPAFEYAGRILAVDIGLSDTAGLLEEIKRFVVDDEYLRSALPSRTMDSHKGDFGTTMMLVGSQSYTGAALLAARAAYRVGVGLVRLGVIAPVYQAIAGHIPEATWLVLPDRDGWVSSQGAGLIIPHLKRARSLLVGCGWGEEEDTQRLFHDLLEADDTILPPMVVDADGLRLLARICAWQSLLPAGSVLTPHPGEMAALTGMTIGEVQADRLGLAGECARAWKQVVVLKGALTVIASPEGSIGLIPVATPALARAGTGDALSGMIAGLIAQGLDSFQAACAAAYLHGMAGLAAAEIQGNTGSVLASDIIAAIPGQVSRIK